MFLQIVIVQLKIVKGLSMKILKELRKQKAKTQSQMGALLGITQQAYATYENGVANPPVDILNKLAEFFGVTTDYLLGRSVVSSLPSNISNVYTPDAIVQFPVIGSIKAGYDGMVEEFSTGESIIIPIEMLGGRPPEDFLAFQVRGNSMYPKLIDGDRVLVLRTDSVDSGATAVVAYNGDEATIKKVVYEQGQDWLDLIPANPEYETRRIKGSDLEQCRIIGKAVKLIRDI